MPQPNWSKLVIQGRAKAIGVPLDDGMAIPVAAPVAEIAASPLTEDEKAFLDSLEETESEETAVETPENDVSEPEATEVSETPENPAIEAEPEETQQEEAGNAPKAEEMSYAELQKALRELGFKDVVGKSKKQLVEMFNAIP
jgi:hypothetical protein